MNVLDRNVNVIRVHWTLHGRVHVREVPAHSADGEGAMTRTIILDQLVADPSRVVADQPREAVTGPTVPWSDSPGTCSAGG